MNRNINLDESAQLMTETPIDWRELFEKYGAYWKWIVGSLIIIVIIGMLYYRSQPNTYQFKSTLLIVDHSKSGEISILKQLDAFGFSGSSSNIYNEKQVLQSKELIKKIVHELKLNYEYQKISMLKPIELYTNSPIEVIMDNDDLGKIGSPIELSVKFDDNTYRISGKYSKDNKATRFKYDFDQLPAVIETPLGQIHILLKNFEELSEDKIYVKIYNPISIVKRYQSSALSTEVPKNGDLVNLTFKAQNIQKGKDFLQKLINTYNQDAIDQINKSAQLTAVFIDSRLDLLTDSLTDVEQKLQIYKQTNELTDIEVEAGLILQKSSLYDQKRIENEIQLQLIEYIEEFLRDSENKYALIPNLGLTDVGLLAVIQEYNKLLISRDRIASGTSESNPTIHNLESQIKSGLISIQNSIATSRKGIQISIRELENQYAFLGSQLKKIPQQEREYIEIKRQQEIKASLYMFLLQKREEASISMAVTVDKAMLLDAADTAEKTSPKLPVILMASILLGLFFPIGTLYLKFLLTHTFNGRKEVEGLTKIPIIAELALEDSDEIIINHGTNTGANAELLRLLRSKLQFILNDDKERLIVITSTEKGEGKTFVAVNLAISLSLTGKKTILLGMDLRKPMLNTHFGISSQEGITSYLSGIVGDYKDLIHPIREYPNLYLLHGGIIPPNPNELILSERFDQLISELREQYDYILIDTAPVGVVSDTFLINRVSNLTLYVCRANYSDKRMFDFINRIQLENSLKKPYLVINGIDLESKNYPGRYGYGYGYGYGRKKKK